MKNVFRTVLIHNLLFFPIKLITVSFQEDSMNNHKNPCPCPVGMTYKTGNCPLFRDLDMLSGRKWMSSIIFLLSERKIRFSDIQKALSPITAKVLSKRLKEMEFLNIVKRHVEISESSVSVSYFLTERGIELLNILRVTRDWSLKWAKNSNTICEVLRDKI